MRSPRVFSGSAAISRRCGSTTGMSSRVAYTANARFGALASRAMHTLPGLRHQAHLPCARHRLRAVAHVQLRIDLLQVVADAVRTDADRPRDDLVRLPPGELADDLELAWAEAFGRFLPRLFRPHPPG